MQDYGDMVTEQRMNIIEQVFRRGNARLLLIVMLLAGLVAEASYVLKSPAVPFLPPYLQGTWIRPNWSTSLVAMYGDVETIGHYRKLFAVSGPTHDILLSITAFKDVEVFLDGNPLPVSAAPSWKEQRHAVLPAHLLADGVHDLKLKITNRMGPPLFHLASDVRMLGEYRGWEFSDDGINWQPALRCRDMMQVDLRKQFPTVADGLRGSLPFILPLFLCTFTIVAMKPRYVKGMFTPTNVKIMILSLWLILGINNMFKIPVFVGFDAEDHVKYIMYLLENLHLPAASEGVQMFQPPLYYAISAVLYRVAGTVFSPETSLVLIRLIPLGCALVLIELSYRILRELMPDREDLQACGLMVGGLLPMNFYMCQYYGNEPLAAVLTAMVLLLTVRMLRKPENARAKDAITLGAIAGFAILAKVTPVLLIPVICCSILLVQGTGNQYEFRSRAKLTGYFLLAATIVSGWFFVRNWLMFGKPFIGGWDASRGIYWWQDPGYRTVRDFISFGEALKQPVYAAFNSIGDGLYSTFWNDGYLSGMAVFAAKPEWNYVLLAAGTALSVIPASAMLAGAGIAFRRTGRPESWPYTFLFLAIAVYLAALMHLNLSLPIFSTAKASYTMGLTPCYAVMAALGAGLFIRKKLVGSLFVAVLVTWGITTYLGFFVM
jgi:hypothetical protein